MKEKKRWNRVMYFFALTMLLLALCGCGAQSQESDKEAQSSMMAGVTAGDAEENLAGGRFLNSTSDVGVMVSEIWYRGQLYVDTGLLMTELPNDCVLLDTICGEDWVTKDPSLVDTKVYRMEGDNTGLYVETAGGYRYYGKGSAGE